MKVGLREKQGIAILDLEGNIDINSSMLVEKVGWVLVNKSKEILCNFEGVNLIDYLGISLLAVVYKNVLNHKGRIAFYNIPAHILTMFSIVGMDRVMEYYFSEDEAITAFRQNRRFERLAKIQFRRRFKRISFKATMEFRRLHPDDSPWYNGKIINLSARGIFITSQDLFSVGDLVMTRMHFLPKQEILEITAKVVWIADKDIQPIDFPSMGLEFEGVSSDTERKIIEFIEKHMAGSMAE